MTSMKARWISVGVVIGLALALTFGFAYGAGRSGPHVGAQEVRDWWAAMEAMHDSPFMEQMRERMGPEWAAQCDRLHDQMQRWIREHPGDAGARMGPGMMDGYGPGRGGPGYGGGMMGPGGMMGS